VLSLPPAFVLSQDQTLKFETLCSIRPKPDVVAAQLTSSQAFSKPSEDDFEALASQTQSTSVPFVRLSPNRQDAAACVSLSFINDVKEPGSGGPKTPDTDENHLRSVARAFVISDWIGDEEPFSASQHSPLSDGGYMSVGPEVSSALLLFFRNLRFCCGFLWKN
jgi:hypothetical protein